MSQHRADAVAQALVQRFRIDVGRLAPVATNDLETGRAKNRRVELVKQ